VSQLLLPRAGSLEDPRALSCSSGSSWPRRNGAGARAFPRISVGGSPRSTKRPPSCARDRHSGFPGTQLELTRRCRPS
jgi:hypothetical protein